MTAPELLYETDTWTVPEMPARCASRGYVGCTREHTLAAKSPDGGLGRAGGCVGGVATLINERLLGESKAVTAQDFAEQAVNWCARVLRVPEEPGAPGW